MDMGTTAVMIGGPAVAGCTNRHKDYCVHSIYSNVNLLSFRLTQPGG